MYGGGMIFKETIRNIKSEGNCLKKLTLKDEGSGSKGD